MNIQYPTSNAGVPRRRKCGRLGQECSSKMRFGSLRQNTFHLDVECSVLNVECSARKGGFTLIEVLIATMILSMGLMVLMTGLGNCAKMVVLAKEYQQAQYVFSLGELKYPIEETDDVEKDLPVSPDSSLVEHFEFERTVDEKKLETNEVDDELYTVRTIVSWGRGENQREELVRYVRKGKKQ